MPQIGQWKQHYAIYNNTSITHQMNKKRNFQLINIIYLSQKVWAQVQYLSAQVGKLYLLFLWHEKSFTIDYIHPTTSQFSEAMSQLWILLKYLKFLHFFQKSSIWEVEYHTFNAKWINFNLRTVHETRAALWHSFSSFS